VTLNTEQQTEIRHNIEELRRRSMQLEMEQCKKLTIRYVLEQRIERVKRFAANLRDTA
jgi:hypothetical protein